MTPTTPVPSRSRRAHAPRAFTLIELLVVIAVIAILLAITMPAIGKSRETARRVKCLTNLRGIGQALAMYQQLESKGLFPKVRLSGDGTTDDPTLLDTLDKHIDAPRPYRPAPDADWVVTDPYRCPSDIGGTDSEAAFKPFWQVHGFSYTYIPGELMLAAELLLMPVDRTQHAVSRTYEQWPKRLAILMDAEDWHHPRFKENERDGIQGDENPGAFDRNAVFFSDMSADKAPYMSDDERIELVSTILRLGGSFGGP